MMLLFFFFEKMTLETPFSLRSFYFLIKTTYRIIFQNVFHLTDNKLMHQTRQSSHSTTTTCMSSKNEKWTSLAWYFVSNLKIFQIQGYLFTPLEGVTFILPCREMTVLINERCIFGEERQKNGSERRGKMLADLGGAPLRYLKCEIELWWGSME